MIKYVKGTIGVRIGTEAYNKISKEAQRRGCTLYQATDILLGIENKLPEEEENTSNLKAENEKLKKENEELLKDNQEREEWSKKLANLRK